MILSMAYYQHLLHNSIFSTTNTIFIINNATIIVASSRPKTQSSKTPPNTPQHHQSSWSRNHIQKHIEQRKHSGKEITQRLAKHYELGKLFLNWNDFLDKILASFLELKHDKEFTLIWVKKICLSIKQKTC